MVTSLLLMRQNNCNGYIVTAAEDNKTVLLHRCHFRGIKIFFIDFESLLTINNIIALVTLLDFFPVLSFYVRYSNYFICRPSDSTVSKDAGIKPRTVVATALAVRHSNHSARSHTLL
jgi:hypothetical protein